MDHTKSATCKFCRAKISFIQRRSYKWTPVESELIIAKEDDEKMILVMADGEKKQGIKKGEVGHKPHACKGR
jgi:hypothetical protein